MYARTLKFLTNLLFKQVFMGFLTRRKKRKPVRWGVCWVCGYVFRAFNKRQHVCVQKSCIKIHRAQQYRKGLERKRLEKKAEMDAIQAKDRAEAAIIIDSHDLESEE